MATLLGIICTDAPISSSVLPALLKTAVNGCFNSISIDGDNSNNGTVVLLAEGTAGGSPINLLTKRMVRSYRRFLTCRKSFLNSLAKVARVRQSSYIFK